jgi:hypothetical protein
MKITNGVLSDHSTGTLGSTMTGSGSPGYIDNYPLKIAFAQTLASAPSDTIGQVYTSYKNGFEIIGAGRESSKRGECLVGTVFDNIDYGDPIIRFK